MKRLLALSLFLSFLIVGFLGCSEDPEEANIPTISVNDQKAIEQNIDIFIKAQYQAMVDRKTEELQRTLADIVVSPEQAMGIAKVAEAIAQGSALDNKPYKLFQTELRFNHERDQFAENRVQISVTESTKLGLGSITSDFTLEHLIVLEQKGKDWKISEDKILNLPDSPTQQESSFFEESAQFSQLEQNLAPTGTTYYQRSSAVNYARCYAYGYNPAYRNWISDDADCTNFVSQCVRAGGWPMTSGFYWWLPCYWWYGTYSRSNSWTVAHDFFVFTVGNGRGTTSTETNLQPGDILSIDYEPDGRINHQMIVSGKNSSGLLLCGHTRARYDAQLNPTIKNAVRIEQNHPNAIFYYVKLRDTF